MSRPITIGAITIDVERVCTTGDYFGHDMMYISVCVFGQNSQVVDERCQ